MPGVKQQRGPNWRGKQLPAARRYVPDMWLSIDHIDVADLWFKLNGVTGLVSITAQPTWEIGPGLTLNTVALVGADLIKATMSAPLPANFTVQSFPLDPAIRSSSGAYISPALLSQSSPTVPTCAFFLTGSVLTAQVNAGYQFSAPADCRLPNAPTLDQSVIVGCPTDAAFSLDVQDFASAHVMTLTPSQWANFVWDGAAWNGTLI